MKKQINEKSFTFIGIAILSIFVLANGCQKSASVDSGVRAAPLGTAIIYTDINPDTELYKGGSVYNIDINNDGIADYTISNYCDFVQLKCLGNNGVLIDTSLHALSALSSGISIGANSKMWKDSSATITYYTWQYGGCGPAAITLSVVV